VPLVPEWPWISIKVLEEWEEKTEEQKAAVNKLLGPHRPATKG
jgi:hypothetical protein